MTGQHIRSHALHTPDKPAIVMAGSGAVTTYAELSRRANQCAHLLHGLGLRPGDHFALLMENRPEYLEIGWAGINSGLFFTPISTHLTAGEVTYILDNSDSRVLFAGADTLERARAQRDQCPRLQHIVPLAGDRGDPNGYHALIEQQPDEPLADERRGAPMVYSSGTTGRPKGILPEQEHVSPLVPTALSALLGSLFHFSGDTVYLSPAPLYHTAPLKFNLAVQGMGGTSVICERFEAEQALASIERYKVTHSQWVPTMFSRFLKLPDAVRNRYDYSSLQVAIHAAAPCPPAVKQAMFDWWGPVIYEYYAGSESIGLCAITPEEFQQRPGSVGRALKGIIHILDDAGRELPTGEVGTIYFEGGGEFSYHKDPEKTRKAHTAKGWGTFGDLGHVDEDGYLYLSDRRDDLIVSGGVNIYPREAEDLLIAHPLVADAAVFGIPNEDYGEEVKACVQLTSPPENAAVLRQVLMDYCREHLSGIKCPRGIDFLKELPRQPNGKLYKKLLRQQYIQQETRS